MFTIALDMVNTISIFVGYEDDESLKAVDGQHDHFIINLRQSGSTRLTDLGLGLSTIFRLAYGSLWLSLSTFLFMSVVKPQESSYPKFKGQYPSISSNVRIATAINCEP